MLQEDITQQSNENNRFSGPGLDDDKKVFVGGIDRNINKNELLDYFMQYGDIENLIIKTNPFTGESRGFAFVQFVNSKSVDNLLAVGEHTIADKKVHLKRVTKKVNPLECQIFVGGLTSEITEQNVRNYFVQFGQLSDYQRPFNKMKNQMRSYCFITFEDSEVVDQVLQNPKPVINGKEIDVQRVKFNPERIIDPVGSAIDPATFGIIPAYPGYMALAAASPYGTAADYGYAANVYNAYGAYGGDDYSANGYGGGGNQAQAYRGGQY
ncbi:RNA-binding protein squid-like [Aphis craccivora]|uniref:RNA-binding protein squid-like n=1 Tax=Aphis craccivora TaxID=307492 RepID=A0A6G0YLD5_APHCR|nr:RNA-binding protein squid-like [Aphis craccivora]